MLVLLYNKNKRVKCPLLSLVWGQAETNYVDGKSWSHHILKEMTIDGGQWYYFYMILARPSTPPQPTNPPNCISSPANRKPQTVRRWLFSWNPGLTEPEEILCDIYHWFWLHTTLARVKRNNERSLAATQSPALKHARTGALLPLNVSESWPTTGFRLDKEGEE